MERITAFTDCNSESIVIRMPYSMIVEILQNCDLSERDELLKKVRRASYRSSKLTQMLSKLNKQLEKKINLPSPAFCAIIEGRELVILKVKIDIDKKETICLEIPKEYQSREGILKYIDESVKEFTTLDDASFEILD